MTKVIITLTIVIILIVIYKIYNREATTYGHYIVGPGFVHGCRDSSKCPLTNNKHQQQ